MKTSATLRGFVCLSVAAVLLLCGSVSRANITGITGWGYSGGIDCYPVFDTSPQLTIGGYQNSTGPVSMWATILADTPADPNLTINNQINNQSGLDWTAFTVTVTMGTTFNLGTTPFVTNPGGWSYLVNQPVSIGGGNYQGSIQFTGGTPVSAAPGPNNLLDYTYQILNFSGSTGYSFNEAVSIVTVPEPASVTFVLLGMGALVCSWRLKQDKQA